MTGSLDASMQSQPKKAGVRSNAATRELVSILLLLGVCVVLGESFGVRWLSIGTTYALLAIVVSGNEVIWGLGGLPSLGYNGFMAVGAYTAALLTTKFGFPPIATIPFSVLVSVGFALFLWPSASRLPPLYFTIATLGFGLIAAALATALVGVTGGPTGLFGIPALDYGGGPLSLREFYYLGWVLALLGVLAVVRLARSRMGLALRVIQADEEVAASCGVYVQQVKLKSFLYGSGLAGFAGAIFAFFFQALTPDSFTFVLVLALFAIQAVGGIGTGYGAVIGALTVGMLDFGAAQTGQYTSILYGVVFLLVIRVAPQGVAGFLMSALARIVPASWGSATDLAEDRTNAVIDDAPAPAIELRADSISQNFGGVIANADVSLAIAPGRVTGIVGANGAGKTTLLNNLTGIGRPDSGSVLFGGEPINDLKTHARAALGIARTFQQPRIMPKLSVLDNVAVGAYTRGRSGLFGGILSGQGQQELAESRTRAYSALADVGISHLAATLASELSFGQVRLLELARAINMNPSVLLLDEPTSGLDADEKESISALLRSLAAKGLAIGLVEHDTDVVANVCDNVYVMDFGKIIAEAPGKTVFTLDVVRQSYLGEEASALTAAEIQDVQT